MSVNLLSNRSFKRLLVALCLSYVVVLSYIKYNEVEDVMDIYIGSTHLVDYEEPNAPYIVVLNTMAQDPIDRDFREKKDMPLYCISDRHEKVDTDWKATDGGMGCFWKNYYVECRFKKPVQSVRLVDGNGYGPQLHVSRPILGKIPLVMCLSRTFYYDNWQVVFTILEMYHAMGVSEFSIHILNVIKEIYEVLKFYEKHINLKVVPGILAPRISGYDPNSKTETMNQIICSNECYFNYREAAEFMIFADMDDLIIPTNGNLLDKARDLLFHQPNIAAFEFFWKTSEYVRIPSINNYSIPRLFNGLISHRNETYGKSILIPKKIDRSIIHNIRHLQYMNVKSLNVSWEDGYTIHLRAQRDPKPGENFDIKHEAIRYKFRGVKNGLKRQGEQNKKDNVKDNVDDIDLTDYVDVERETKDVKKIKKILKKQLQNDAPNLIPLDVMARATYNFRRRLQHKTFYDAVFSLPDAPFFSPQFRQCYIDITSARETENSLCASLSNCHIDYTNGPKCLVTTADNFGYEYKKLNVYVSKHREVVEKDSCRLEMNEIEYVQRMCLLTQQSFDLGYLVLCIGIICWIVHKMVHNRCGSDNQNVLVNKV
ncbi:unnamed protein product [Bursaphelenchus okinawaensis]|uniref:Glycosyltransferase family 92 protein n=1 Tax=Bursaphelenchus okinawaensis TaxID=465554 RepID=A0A811K5L3_9BILA|nr:unnamed protein product [Bursaphelenchus okinawaensis]CAG9091747.1 unnamed protein product [Bursaphelenchus okinawaensis]